MRRAGMTLYEVVLALAIFVGALAALGPLATTGMRAAVHAKLETQAILRCESKLAEVLAGIESLSPVNDAAFEDDASGWTWNLIVSNGPRTDLLILEVAVAHVNELGDQDATYSIVRMLRNPDVLADLEESSSSSGKSNEQSSSGSQSSSSGSSSQPSGSTSR